MNISGIKQHYNIKKRQVNSTEDALKVQIKTFLGKTTHSSKVITNGTLTYSNNNIL